MIQGISAIWLPVSDMQRAVTSYRDSLGLEVLEHDGDWTEPFKDPDGNDLQVYAPPTDS